MVIVKDWPLPKCHRDIQVFLGFANSYRRFIEKYLNITQSLIDMLVGRKARKFKGPFLITKDAWDAFSYFKTAFTTVPVLIHYDPEKPI